MVIALDRQRRASAAWRAIGVRLRWRDRAASGAAIPGAVRLELETNGDLVLYTLCLEHSPQGENYDLQVEPQRLRFHVLRVILNLEWNLQFVAAVDLCPAGDSRNQA